MRHTYVIFISVNFRLFLLYHTYFLFSSPFSAFLTSEKKFGQKKLSVFGKSTINIELRFGAHGPVLRAHGRAIGAHGRGRRSAFSLNEGAAFLQRFH